jgi:hypothetical protein
MRRTGIAAAARASTDREQPDREDRRHQSAAKGEARL